MMIIIDNTDAVNNQLIDINILILDIVLNTKGDQFDTVGSIYLILILAIKFGYDLMIVLS